MSVRLANIDLATVSGSTTIDTQGIQLSQCGWIEFLNESPYTVELAMGGINVPIPAWYSYPIQLQEKRNGFWQLLTSVSFPATVTPLLIANNLTKNISTLLLTTLYLTGETPANTAPQPLARQTFVPNTVNNVSGTASSVQNDGNTAGTSVVEATVSGDVASAVSIFNNGIVDIGTSANPGLITISNSFGTNGQISTDAGGFLTVNRGINANLITATSENDIGLHVASGHEVVITVNGIDIMRIESTGIRFLNPTTQPLSNGSTITIPGTYVHVSCASSVTGIIMTPGGQPGQLAFLYNNGPGNLTFAASGSNVRLGSTITVNNAGIATLIWDGGNWGISKAA